MSYLLRLSSLRKSVWSIINKIFALRATSQLCTQDAAYLHSRGYGASPPDDQLRVVIHAATDVDGTKLTS